MDARLTVQFDDGRKIEVTAKTRDQLAWEKAAPGRSFGAFLTDMVTGQTKLQDLYSLAFAAMRRQGLYSGTLKELEDSAEVRGGHDSEAEIEADESEVDGPSDQDPTHQGPSADN